MPGPTTRHTQFIPGLPATHGNADLVCLSHLRWDFVFQRPQHLMTRFAAERRVFFIEEPIADAAAARIEVQVSHGVHVVVPHLPPDLTGAARLTTMRHLLGTLFTSWHIEQPLLWFYTPMAWPLVSDVDAELVVYDCMDELSAFRGAPPELVARERELFARADVVFTGGHSLYEAKRLSHRFVHPIPSSVDVAHFARARRMTDPPDQRELARPRLGFAGVIDERMDLDLLGAVAEARPEWQIVMIGPTVKIDPATLPKAPNIHYLGMRKYDELPAYFSGWDVALLPFALNEATRYISPTKTPEYLAAGCPVVSTSVRDVVRPYGERGVVQIADTPEDFVRAIERQLTPEGRRSVAAAESLLAAMSWDRTWATMAELIEEARDHRPSRLPATPGTFVFGPVQAPRPATSPS